MDLERERGITIKLQAARALYTAKDGKEYTLNLIDTPGHVDFTYEVSRSLAACEGALLVVDASQGVEAQTVANVYLALENDLEVLPVLNKIDLPAADPDRVGSEIEATIGLDCSDAVHCSAKTGLGIQDILEYIVASVPPPPPVENLPLKALIFDSLYDPYKGVVVFFRVVQGALKAGDKVRFLNSRSEHDVVEVGVMTPGWTPVEALRAGEVGYLFGSIKDVLDARVGDTIALQSEYKTSLSPPYAPLTPLPGYADSKPMMFAGLFPTDADDYETLRDSLQKLRLNDAALTFEPENSGALGFGFRIGFLGLLHMEIIQERLEREYDLDLIVTAPSVVYEVETEKGEKVIVDSPAKMPEGRKVTSEPYVRLEVLTPSEYNGKVMELGQERRGQLIDIKYMTEDRSSIVYELPLAEVITDFFDQLKSRTKGYSSMEYKVIGYRESDLVRLDVLINGEQAPPLSTICHASTAQRTGRGLVTALKEHIPRQLFKVQLQAAVGVKVIASTTISAMRKDVTAKCYGGDISRKKKLLKKQAAGKKRMKMMGNVEVPQKAFTAVLKIDRGSGGE